MNLVKKIEGPRAEGQGTRAEGQGFRNLGIEGFRN
jgi:hypothetical protein